MYHLAKLVVKAYQPPQLEVGMFFVMQVNVNSNAYLYLYELDAMPRNIEEHYTNYGYPVKPYIVGETSTNPDAPEIVLAYPNEIAWVDYSLDELHEIDVNFINHVLEQDGWIEIWIEDEHGPYVEDGKVVIRDYDVSRYEDYGDDELVS